MLDSELDQVVNALESHYFGKYRGLVVDNQDPLSQGRIQVRVPAVRARCPRWRVAHRFRRKLRPALWPPLLSRDVMNATASSRGRVRG